MARSNKPARITKATGSVARRLPAGSGLEAQSQSAVSAPADAPRKVVSRRRRLIIRSLIGVGIVALVLIAAGFGYAYWTVQKAMPTTSGNITLAGMSAPATVTRDKFGVPHIVAANVNDLYMAQGYVHAQDRLFQMYYFRQLGQGRLAESFGAAAQQADVFLRTLGMRRAAEAEYKILDPTVQKALQSYAAGVNAFLHTHTDAMPLEFVLTGLHMDDWQPVDTVTFGKVMSYDLSGNWDTELITADLISKLGPQKAAELIPGYPGTAPVTVPNANSGSLHEMLQAFNGDIRKWLPETGISGLGSNNWVIDGTKSATGKPMLSNDPHLSVQNPSIWYQVALKTTDGVYDLAGFGFAGVPGIVTGHNQKIAWGVTNTEGDVQDLFMEKTDAQGHPGQYETPSGWKPFQVLTETIAVKGSDSLTQTIRISDHGPIISDALATNGTKLGTSVTDPLAFKWTALEPGHLMEAVFKLQTASNWQEFRQALSSWSVPGQNFVYADQQGNIGYQMTGDQPIRKKGDGTVPVPGWTGEYDWSGYVPFDSLPRLYNPPEHFIATANNKPFGASYSQPIQGLWAPPWRITRIREMLTAKDKLSMDDLKHMLLDTHSELAKQVAPVFGSLRPQDGAAQQAVAATKGWDGNMSVDSSAASIYEVTIERAISDTLGDDLGAEQLSEYMGGDGAHVLEAFGNLIQKPDDPLWDVVGTPAKETRDQVLTNSLTEAVGDLRQVYGDNMADWTWGKLHTIQPTHPFGSQPVLSGIFNLQALPFGGDGTTVAASGYDLLNPYAMRSHQSYRMILDLSNWSNSVSVFAGGESGQPYNKHWDDIFPLWQQGLFNPLLYSSAEVEANKEAVLTLSP